ncbi:two-partner secretion domain-containing protein, partial [Dyella jejuensis]
MHRPFTQASSFSLSRRALSAAVIAALLGSPWTVQAQVVADPNAGAHRPGIGAAGNGVPVVNLVAPSAAGVSHNPYQQFNVDKQGLILNNAAGVSATQLGGYIVGNPHYRAGQAAKVIVNEVTSLQPTSLRGYTEVAGQAADVIIANPNGISVNGGGFINTNRATLTTGTPSFGADGSLSGLRTGGGHIRIDGEGLNASHIDRLDLITRSLSVSGKVWAHHLNVITGANQVGYSDLSTQAIAGTGEAPTVSIDVATLGGMYANTIHLIGTEAGLGMRNAGELATQSGDFTIDEAGQLQLTGTTSSAGHLALTGSALNNSGALQSAGSMTVQSTGDITNTGTVYSGGDLAMQSAGAVSHAGVIAAANEASVRAQQLASTGTLGAGVARDGTLQGNAALSVVTAGALSSTGSHLASGAITLQGSALDLSGAQTRAGGDVALVSTAGDIDHAKATLATDGALTVHSAGTVDNSGGTLQAAQLDAQAAGDWRNAYGSVMQTGSGPMSVRIGGLLDNTHGTWIANADTVAINAHAIDNTGGAIEQAGTGTLAITTGTLTNDQGQILGNGDLALTARTARNQDGTLSVAGNATLAGSDLDNTGGTVVAQRLQGQFTGSLINPNGVLQAHQAQLIANTLDNGNGQIKALDGNLDLTVWQALTNGIGGFLGSNAAVHLHAGTLSNAGQVYAGSDLTLTTQGDASNTGAMHAQGSLNAHLGGALANDNGALEAGTGQGDATLTLDAASLSNQGGRIANTDNGTTTVNVTGSLDNTRGTLGGQGDVTLNAAQVVNAGGTLVSGGSFALQSDALSNNGGTLYSAGHLIWTTATATLDNTHGSIGAGGDLTLTLDTVHNDGGDLASNHDVAAQLGHFDGVGRLRAGNDLSLALAGDYINPAGNTLFANNDFTVTLGGAFTNAAGATLQSAGALTLTANSLDNQAGAAINSATTTLTAATQTNEGRIEGDTVTLNAGDLTNTGTVIGNAITVHARTLTNGADL